MTKSRRWIILSLLFVASVINYVDRQSLSILATTIQKDLSMDNVGYAHVVQMFLLAYMVSFLFAGWVTDRLGSRVGMILFIAWWSVANLLTGLVTTVSGLAGTRFLLGAGESGLYTVAPKIVGQIFPPSQRGVAVGLYSSGATIGATIAPPLIAYVTLSYGWRAAFVVGGTLGLLWIIPWALFSGGAQTASPGPASPAPALRSERTWWRVVVCPQVFLLLALRAITDPAWQFILYWFPKYLAESRGMSLSQSGKILWVVYLGADLGGIGAGYLCGLLVRCGLIPRRACQSVMTACALVIPLCAAIPFVPSQAGVIALATLVALCVFAFMICATTLAVEVLPADRFGTAWGVVCMGSGFGGMLFANAVGHLVTWFSYRPVFALMACLHPISLLIVWSIKKSHEATSKAA